MESINESKAQLKECLSDAEFNKLPILVVCNKQDLPYARKQQEVRSLFYCSMPTNKLHYISYPHHTDSQPFWAGVNATQQTPSRNELFCWRRRAIQEQLGCSGRTHSGIHNTWSLIGYINLFNVMWPLAYQGTSLMLSRDCLHSLPYPLTQSYI